MTRRVGRRDERLGRGGDFTKPPDGLRLPLALLRRHEQPGQQVRLTSGAGFCEQLSIVFAFQYDIDTPLTMLEVASVGGSFRSATRSMDTSEGPAHDDRWRVDAGRPQHRTRHRGLRPETGTSCASIRARWRRPPRDRRRAKPRSRIERHRSELQLVPDRLDRWSGPRHGAGDLGPPDRRALSDRVMHIRPAHWRRCLFTDNRRMRALLAGSLLLVATGCSVESKFASPKPAVHVAIVSRRHDVDRRQDRLGRRADGSRARAVRCPLRRGRRAQVSFQVLVSALERLRAGGANDIALGVILASSIPPRRSRQRRRCTVRARPGPTPPPRATLTPGTKWGCPLPRERDQADGTSSSSVVEPGRRSPSARTSSRIRGNGSAMRRRSARSRYVAAHDVNGQPCARRRSRSIHCGALKLTSKHACARFGPVL